MALQLFFLRSAQFALGATAIAGALDAYAQSKVPEAGDYFNDLFPGYPDQGQEPHWDTFRHLYVGAKIAQELKSLGMSEADAEVLLITLGEIREVTWVSSIASVLTLNATTDQAKKDLFNNQFAPQLGFNNPDDGDLASAIKTLIDATDTQIANSETPTGVILYADAAHPDYEMRLNNELVLEKNSNDLMNQLVDSSVDSHNWGQLLGNYDSMSCIDPAESAQVRPLM